MQTIVNQPTLLTLSVTSNLRPKAALFRDELGARESDIAEIINRCPRVMNASVERRILPRMQVVLMFWALLYPTHHDIRSECSRTFVMESNSNYAYTVSTIFRKRPVMINGGCVNRKQCLRGGGDMCPICRMSLSTAALSVVSRHPSLRFHADLCYDYV